MTSNCSIVQSMRCPRIQRHDSFWCESKDARVVNFIVWWTDHMLACAFRLRVVGRALAKISACRRQKHSLLQAHYLIRMFSDQCSTYFALVFKKELWALAGAIFWRHSQSGLRSCLPQFWLAAYRIVCLLVMQWRNRQAITIKKTFILHLFFIKKPPNHVYSRRLIKKIQRFFCLYLIIWFESERLLPGLRKRFSNGGPVLNTVYLLDATRPSGEALNLTYLTWPKSSE